MGKRRSSGCARGCTQIRDWSRSRQRESRIDNGSRSIRSIRIGCKSRVLQLETCSCHFGGSISSKLLKAFSSLRGATMHPQAYHAHSIDTPSSIKMPYSSLKKGAHDCAWSCSVSLIPSSADSSKGSYSVGSARSLRKRSIVASLKKSLFRFVNLSEIRDMLEEALP